jgi:hypothetical protein
LVERGDLALLGAKCLSGLARSVIRHLLHVNPRVSSQVAWYDVASALCKTLARGVPIGASFSLGSAGEASRIVYRCTPYHSRSVPVPASASTTCNTLII